VAQQGADANSIFTRRGATISPVEVENMRERLRVNLSQGQTNPQQVTQLEERLDRMSAAQIRELASRYGQQRAATPQQTLAGAQRQLSAAQATRQRLANEYQSRLQAARRNAAGYSPQVYRIPQRGFVPTAGAYAPYGYYPQPRVVGYIPNVTWLPTGASLTAGGTVSPDGRYVRVTAQPFFSSVPAVYTFNPYTGQYRRVR
jgi:hypothetical protein